MDHDLSLSEIARFLRRLQWAAVGLFVVWLLWLLAPVLTAFVIAAMLGWLGDPLVGRIENAGRSRNTAGSLGFAAMRLVLVLVLVILVPLVERQIATLIDSMPRYRDWLLQTAIPWLEMRTRIEISSWLDFNRLVDLIRTNWQRAGGMATTVLGYVSRSGFAILALVANIALLPVLTRSE